MSPEVEKVLEDALKLPVEARAAIAGSLIQSLDEGVYEGAEDAWDAEIARRIQELDSGKVRPVPWSEVRRRLLEP